MPDTNGVDVAQRIRTEYPSIKIIVLSIDNREFTLIKLLKIGMDGFVSKSSPLSDIPLAIDSVANGVPFYGRDISILIRDITDANYSKREAARRAALNAPVQGSAADLIKIAMIKIDKFLKENHYQTKMVLQIHDELLFRVPDTELEEVYPKLKEIMEHAVELPVKLEVEGAAGESWYSAKD
jgi:CheY-like chemotaxis protein